MSNEPPDLDHFDLDTAWLIGTALATDCRDQQLPVTISIQLGIQSVVHARVPIRVRDSMIGVLAVSGLESTEDHELAVSALRLAGGEVR
jgi:uncharacterized protein (UPF0303 family)